MPDSYYDEQVGVNTDPDNFPEVDENMIRNINAGYNESYDVDYDYSDMPDLMTNMINGIFGIPYQFSEIVDIPVQGTDFGRKYMEKVIANMPVLFISPGEPIFMPGYNNRTIKSMVNAMLDNEDDSYSIEDMTDGVEGRYYSFNPDMYGCSNYINTAARALAKFKGIENERIPTPTGGNMRLKNMKIQSLLNPSFQRYFGAQTSFPFYLDSETQISESFSNDTTESMLAQKANSMTDTAREIQFLMGTHGVTNSNLYNSVHSAVGSTLEGMGNLVDSLPVGKNILGALTNELTTVVAGGKMVFAEIWSSSGYSRSYSINIKLRSPDPDPLSIFLNVDLPILVLVSMAAGRQFGTSANSYGSPYLVRCTYKSVFACDGGIISSLDITRGGEGKWNSAGMATSADITITIKDLYSTMFISKTPAGMVNNIAELDWLALMAGLDMNQTDYTRRLNLGLYLAGSQIAGTPDRLWNRFAQGMNQTTARFLSKLGMDMRYN